MTSIVDLRRDFFGGSIDAEREAIAAALAAGHTFADLIEATSFAQAQIGNRLASGEASVERLVANSTSTLSTGNLRLSYFTARKTETCTKVSAWSHTTAAGATPTLCRMGVYSVNLSTGALTLLAACANDTSLFSVINTEYEKTLTSNFDKVAGTRYAAAALVVTAQTAPVVASASLSVAGLGATLPRLTGLVAGQTDLPASIAAASINNSGNMPYIAFRP